eukprot:8337168-Karenia_brevis.AAC.1
MLSDSRLRTPKVAVDIRRIFQSINILLINDRRMRNRCEIPLGQHTELAPRLHGFAGIGFE